ncbi:MAG: ABC-F family ATP-binding cassette domain-containing protein [Blautia sp.]|uniref:ABC-F family ATP-binding cassette domain-containing protein n=1 Tax=Blautia sp. TaxID=1955243 RepID=UPI002E7728FC|nr:ABC-F family ATP-binding cassette domain-containing protein [Blautia sp.]MEE1444946.1 ABC-F family ATP-binding cassette domain-containing protein [Blautia sp.]
MNIINIEHISKIYGDKTIFQDASFGVHQGDKIGIIGINGTGKSTLLKMVAQVEEPDEGQIIRQNSLKIAYLPQNPEFPEHATVHSYAMDGNSDTDWMVQSNLNQLGIVEDDTLLEHLSGGQRRKVAMAKILASDFDVLLLDEPTNHLDEQMIAWLEDYLRNFRGTVMMVTHDRYFMDKVTNKILEISHGNIYSYEANYSRFLELKAEREEMELASERKRQSILRMELEWAKRGCRARSTKQRARLERLEALKNGKAPVQDQTIELDSVETRMGKKTIELQHVSKSYGDKKLVEDFSYILLKNQRLGIIGPNGCGKSTLMKMMAGLVEPDEGSVEMGETIKIGYFAQEEQEMDDNQRVIDYVKDIAEYITTREGKVSASQMLERFLFTPDMQYAPIGKLSGGEKRRLYLLGVLSSEINLLLLDEPGNNLDIPTLTILEDYLNAFSGIVVTVSHDRYFLDNVVDRIFEFDGNGHLQQYEGGYTDYLEAKERRGFNETNMTAKTTAQGEKRTENKKESAETWKQNRPVKLKFTFKEQREYETIDDEIAALEEKIEKLDQDIMANATNSGKLNELTKAKEQAEAELEEKMERWVYLNDLAEKIEAQKKA